ncbi:MAG TPA: trigger factor [Dehalococcoidia bacterium]|nr:trigger factor [Dehalococcoidia bacterium]
MRVSAERIPQSQVVLQIEIEPDQMERALDKAYRRLVQRAEIPGFRKGKAPRDMVERHLGRERLVHEALDTLIPEAYNQALDEQQIDAIDQPRLDIVQEEPLVFKATVPIRPTVRLGDHGALRVKRPTIEVAQEDVDRAVEELRHRYALHEPVERPVDLGDLVRADVRGHIEGREVFADDDFEFTPRDGATILLPGFAEGVLGAEKGVPKDVQVTTPPGSQPLSGKTGTFTVVVKEVKEEKLPALDDEFARQVGEGFASLQALRQQLEGGIRERLEAEAEEMYRGEALTALLAQAEELEFPPVLVEREIDRLLRDEARAAGHDVDHYVEQLRKPVQEIRDALRPAAEERVRRSLALTALAEAEQIVVEPAEVDEEIERIVNSSGAQAPQIRQLFASPGGREAIERSLLTRKTSDRLVEVVSGPKPGAKPAAARKRKAKAAVQAAQEE